MNFPIKIGDKHLSTSDPKVDHVEEEFDDVVILLLDCSSSMDGNKIAQAKDGAIGFAKEAVKQGYAVGLVLFAELALYSCKPSTSLDRFINKVKAIQVDGSTNLTAGLVLSKRVLSSYDGERIICLVTDGVPNDEKTALRERNNIKEMDIKIITRGTTDADKNFLAKLATDEDLSEIVDDDDLEEAIEDMSRLLPPAKKKY